MKLVKYLAIFCGIIVVLGITAIIALPFFVKVEKYKPQIEKMVTEKTGYELTLGNDIDVSIFPWVGLSFSDLQLKNQQGFEQSDFIKIKSFQTRLKVMPLLEKKVEVASFVLEGPEIVVTRTAKGVWNWEGLTKLGGEKKIDEPTVEEKKSSSDFAIESIEVGEFSIKDGRVIIDDKTQKMRKELSGFSLDLQNISFDKAVRMDMAFLLDNMPFSLNGQVGPFGQNFSATTIPFDVKLGALDNLDVAVQGKVMNPMTAPAYEVNGEVGQFNPRNLMTNLSMKFPVQTADETALTKVGLTFSAKGNTAKVDNVKADITLDDTHIDVTAKLNNFTGPDLAATLNVDQINLDRYLPPKQEEKAESQKQQKAAESTPIDYTPLRKLVVDAKAEINNIEVQGGKVDKVTVHVKGKKGVIHFNPVDVLLYDGKVATKAVVNVQKSKPVVTVNNRTEGVQVGPLLQDFAKKDVLEGAANSEVELRFRGDDPEMIKKTLNGKGQATFLDGAIVGVDLAQLARNLKGGFLNKEKQAERPKTDFAEFVVPFTITNGLVNTDNTYMKSPFIRMNANGDVNLVNEKLDLRIKPKVIASMKGQGDTEDRSGFSVPIKVTGTFEKPKVGLDLEEAAKDELLNPDNLTNLLGGKKEEGTDDTNKPADTLKKKVEDPGELLKGLFGN